MTRKVATVVALGLGISIALTGCAGASGTSGSSSSKSGGLITIVVNDPSNPYWLTEGNVASAEAKKLGYTTTIAASKGDVNTEASIISTALSNHPANASGSIGNVKKAIAAKIPVFLVNAEINQTGLALAQLVSNNAQGAALGAQEWVKDVGTTGKYAQLLGLPSDNNAATRSNGYTSVISQYPGLIKVAEQTANWDRTLGQQKMQSILQANPDINAVISGNDEMALGAIAALKQAGKLAQVKVGGFDGSPDAVAAIKSGELQYTVLQPVALFAAKAVDEMNDYITKGTKPATEKQSFDCILINKSNVDKMTDPFTLSK
jgi:erythritol transport system substrate-binding protein